MRHTLALLVFFALSIAVYTQSVPSVTTADTKNPFISIGGRFSIALPEKAAIAVLGKTLVNGSTQAEGFEWHMSETTISVLFADKPESMHLAGDREILEGVRDSILAMWRFKFHDKERDTSDELVLHGNTLGREFRWEIDGVLTYLRCYMDNNRLYEVRAEIPESQKNQKGTVTKILSTFKVLSSTEMKRLTKK